MASMPNSGGNKSKLMKAHMIPTTAIGVTFVCGWVVDTTVGGVSIVDTAVKGVAQ